MCSQCSAGLIPAPIPPHLLLILLLIILPLRRYPLLIPPLRFLYLTITFHQFLVSPLQCNGLTPSPPGLFHPSILLFSYGLLVHFPSGFIWPFLVLCLFCAKLLLQSPPPVLYFSVPSPWSRNMRSLPLSGEIFPPLALQPLDSAAAATASINDYISQVIFYFPLFFWFW